MTEVARVPSSLAKPPSSKAKTPFDNTKLADIIIRSSDNVDFYLVRAILIISSSFFEGMFSLAQPVPVEPDRGLDIIPVSEDSETFDCLVRLCYPVKDPTMESLTSVEKILAAARKYEMEEAIDLARRALRAFVAENPRQVYAVACRQQADDEALSAAQRWREMQSGVLNDLAAQFPRTPAGGSYTPEMRTISASAYFRLLHFFRVGTFPATPSSDTPTTGNTRTSHSPHIYGLIIATADITLRSFDGINHPANTTVLRAASAGRLVTSGTSQTKSKGKGSLPVISVDLHSSVLSDVIAFCYPFSDMRFNQVQTIRAVAEVAQKYDMHLVIDGAKRKLRDTIHQYPLSAFFTSVILGWDNEAEHAARCVVEQGVDLAKAYVPEMEDTQAHHYHRLLEYKHRYSQSLQVAIGAPAAADLYQVFQALDGQEKRHDALSFVPATTLKVLSAVRTYAQTASGTRCHNCSRGYGYSTSQPRFPDIPIVSALVSQSRELQSKLAELKLAPRECQ